MDNVTIATSIRYGNYKRYYKTAQLQAEFTKMVLVYARKILELPEKGISVHIKPIRGNCNGNCNRFFLINMETRRRSMGDFLVVLMHELVHAEQYITGKLSGNKWHGIEYKRGSTYKKYRALPWEEEAWGRQEELAQQILRMMSADGVDVEGKYEYQKV